MESRIQKILSRYDLTVADVAADIEVLFKQVVLDNMEVDLPARFEDAAQLIEESIEQVRALVVETDPTLEKSLEATRASLRNEWSRLEGRVLKAEKRQHDDDRRRLDRVQESLYPSAGLQERGLSILSFLNKYGPGFAGELMAGIETDTREHQVLVLG